MGVFDDILASNQSIVKNEMALDYEFLPKILPYREAEQREIASAIAPLFRERSGRNLLIHGPPGIGKTAATRHVLRELEEKSEEIEVVFVNCWKHNTTHKIALEICEQIGFKFTQNLRTQDLYKKIASIVNKSSGVLVFDEIDKAEDYDFLYTLLEELYKKTILMITNYKSFVLEIDERIKSRLSPELVEFSEYNEQETRGILRDRLSYAFHDDVWPEDSFNLLARKAYELRDIRAGLDLMRKTALICEEQSKKKVERGFVEKAMTMLDDISRNKHALDDDLQFILDIVKKNSGKKIGDLYRLYEKEGGTHSYKTFQRKLARLDEGKYLSLNKETGAGGNTTIVNKRITDY